MNNDISQLERELHSLSIKPGRQASHHSQAQTGVEGSTPNYKDPAYSEDLAKYPITEEEQKAFDDAVAALNRRRYALVSDIGLSDIEKWINWDWKIRAMLNSQK